MEEGSGTEISATRKGKDNAAAKFWAGLQILLRKSEWARSESRSFAVHWIWILGCASTPTTGSDDAARRRRPTTPRVLIEGKKDDDDAWLDFRLSRDSSGKSIFEANRVLLMVLNSFRYDLLLDSTAAAADMDLEPSERNSSSVTEALSSSSPPLNSALGDDDVQLVDRFSSSSIVVVVVVAGGANKSELAAHALPSPWNAHTH